MIAVSKKKHRTASRGSVKEVKNMFEIKEVNTVEATGWFLTAVGYVALGAAFAIASC